MSAMSGESNSKPSLKIDGWKLEPLVLPDRIETESDRIRLNNALINRYVISEQLLRRAEQVKDRLIELVEERRNKLVVGERLNHVVLVSPQSYVLLKRTGHRHVFNEVPLASTIIFGNEKRRLQMALVTKSNYASLSNANFICHDTTGSVNNG